MASEEIKLVGSFKDDITPQLKKLSREMANMGRSFERFNKKLAPVTKSSPRWRCRLGHSPKPWVVREVY